MAPHPTQTARHPARAPAWLGLAMALGLAGEVSAQGTVIAMPLPTPPPRAAGAIGDAAVCDHHGAVAEAALQLPSGLLRAIGRVESGRRDPASGAFAPWPWTINANGQGRFFPDAASAAQAVRELRAAGTTSIDVGCFQVNLHHHPQAFQSLEDAFSPAANAAYAAAFLTGLKQKFGAWDPAVAAYHSADPERGEPYRQRVFAAWNQRTAPAPAPAEPERTGPLVFRFAGASEDAPESEVRVWSPSRRGTAPTSIEMPKVTAGTPPGGNISTPAATVIPLPPAITPR